MARLSNLPHKIVYLTCSYRDQRMAKRIILIKIMLFLILWDRGILISGGWNRGVPEVSSFQGVGIEEFQRYPHFRGLE